MMSDSPKIAYLNQIIKPGDIAVIDAPGLAAWFQELYAKRYQEGPPYASHGFLCRGGGVISEADGMSIHQSPLSKYEDAAIWIFRFSKMTSLQMQLIMTYVRASENGDARYSWSGIWSFVKSFFTGKRTFTDPDGEFCTDYTGQAIIAAGLPYLTALNPWEVDPTTQLAWFLSPAAQAAGWISVFKP